jgi:hypothetical protein
MTEDGCLLGEGMGDIIIPSPYFDKLYSKAPKLNALRLILFFLFQLFYYILPQITFQNFTSRA